jgi:nucleoside-diphosphate-sugar epimerase
MKILVTGSSGVISRELIPLLKDHKVLAIDKVVPKEQLPDNLMFLQRNIGKDDIPEIQNNTYDIVFHLAASFERLEESPDFLQPNWDDNLQAFHYIANNVNAKTFVFASSYLVYSAFTPINFTGIMKFSESSILNPRNLCGMSKLYAEKELEFIQKHANTDINVINARIFRSYGIGSNDIVSRFIRDMIANKDTELYNQENSFDYIYAGDVAMALWKLSQLNKTITCNVGSGISTKIRKIFRYIYNKIEPINHVNVSKNNNIENSVADISLLESATNWKPETTIEQGIDKIIEYELVKYGGTI